MASAAQARRKPAESVSAGKRAGDGKRFASLLGKAAALIASKGYHHTSMRDVSRAADCSLAGLYHYFESKEDVLFQIQQRFFSTLVDEQVAIRDSDEPVEQRFRALIQHHLAFFDKHADELKVCTFELHSLTGEQFSQVAAIRRKYFQLMAHVMRDLLDEGSGKATDLRVRQQTMFLFGALNWIFMWYDTRKDGPVDKVGEELTQLVLHGLRGKPGAAGATKKASRSRP